jgi:diguanylate cyclase (GGDEF)-like protein/PAS domain S-box-containing protein
MRDDMDDKFIRYALDKSAIVASTDRYGIITFANEKFCEISGYSQRELIGFNHRILNSGFHHRDFFNQMYHMITAGNIWRGEICNRKKDGSIYWVYTTIVPYFSTTNTEIVDGYVSIRFDITSKKEMEQKLLENIKNLDIISNTDFLTGLPNRRYFSKKIENFIIINKEKYKTFNLSIIDIDFFKEINDSYGHEIGDHVLTTIASRLSSIVDEDVCIARLGGDEFGIIINSKSNFDNVEFSKKILETVQEPIKIGSIMRRFSASMGCAIFPQHGNDRATLFQAADIALYRAKEAGRNKFDVFNEETMGNIKCKSKIISDFNIGLKNNEIEFFYQPIVYPQLNKDISFEALVRWNHPTRGLLNPGTFQTVFTDPATCAVFGLYLLDHIFSDILAMLEQGIQFGRIGINLTNDDFRSDVFLDRFFNLCAETGIGPERFCIEVTESILLGDAQRHVEQRLHQLHCMGVEVALDDFGTGYASLTHLREFPIDRLKIDQRFVSNIETSLEDQVIVRGIIDIAHGLGKTITAEGVETAQQAEILLDMQCDSLQGWLFSKALPVNDISSSVDLGLIDKTLRL